jgi:hypothetical protein
LLAAGAHGFSWVIKYCGGFAVPGGHGADAGRRLR